MKQEIVVSRFRFARDRQGVNRQAAIREAVTGRVLRCAAQLFAEIAEQFFRVVRGHREFLFLRESQRETAIGAPP